MSFIKDRYRHKIWVKLIAVFLVHSMVVSDIAFAYPDARNSCLAPPLATNPPAEVFKDEWAIVAVSYIIAQMLVITKTQGLKKPSSILIPLIHKHIEQAKIEAQVEREGLDVDNITDVVKDGGQVIGFSLPILRKGSRAYTMFYNFENGDMAIDVKGVKVHAQVIYQPLRISLIYPSSKTATVGVGSRKDIDQFLPLGIARIAGSLREWAEKRHVDLELQVIDMPTMGYDADKVADLIERFKPDMAGFSVLTPSVDAAENISMKIKRASPETVIVWGGPHTTLAPESAEKLPCVDVTVRYGGEMPMCELADAMVNAGNDRKKFFESVAEMKGMLADRDKRTMESLARPAYDLFPLEKYRWRGRAVVPVESHRGCHGRCGFCVVPELFPGGIVEAKPEDFVETLAGLHDKYGFDYFYIVDDNFTVNPRWVREVADLMEKKNLHAGLEIYASADTIASHPSMVNDLKRMGVQTVFIGVESGDEKVMASLKKKITFQEVDAAVQMLDKAGMVILTSFMIGSPEDTEGSIRKSIAYAEHLKTLAPVILHLTHAIPYPGTELYDEAVKYDLVKPDDWQKLDPHGEVVTDTRYISKQRVGELESEFLASFWTQNYQDRILALPEHREVAIGFIEAAVRHIAGISGPVTASKPPPVSDKSIDETDVRRAQLLTEKAGAEKKKGPLKVLLVCNQAIERSPMLTALLKVNLPDDLWDKVTFSYAALYTPVKVFNPHTQSDSILKNTESHKITPEEFDEADVIFVMNGWMKDELKKRFRYNGDKIQRILDNENLDTTVEDYPSDEQLLIGAAFPYQHLRKVITENLDNIFERLRKIIAELEKETKLPPPGSIPGVFAYLLNKKIFSAEKALSGEEIARRTGLTHPDRKKELSFATIERDLNDLCLHLYLIKKVPGSGSGRDARYYVPEKVRNQLESDDLVARELWTILKRFTKEDLRPDTAFLDDIYTHQIRPLLRAEPLARAQPKYKLPRTGRNSLRYFSNIARIVFKADRGRAPTNQELKNFMNRTKNREMNSGRKFPGKKALAKAAGLTYDRIRAAATRYHGGMRGVREKLGYSLRIRPPERSLSIRDNVLREIYALMYGHEPTDIQLKEFERPRKRRTPPPTQALLGRAIIEALNKYHGGVKPFFEKLGFEYPLDLKNPTNFYKTLYKELYSFWPTPKRLRSFRQWKIRSRALTVKDVSSRVVQAAEKYYGGLTGVSIRLGFRVSVYGGKHSLSIWKNYCRVLYIHMYRAYPSKSRLKRFMDGKIKKKKYFPKINSLPHCLRDATRKKHGGYEAVARKLGLMCHEDLSVWENFLRALFKDIYKRWPSDSELKGFGKYKSRNRVLTTAGLSGRVVHAAERHYGGIVGVAEKLGFRIRTFYGKRSLSAWKNYCRALYSHMYGKLPDLSELASFMDPSVRKEKPFPVYGKLTRAMQKATTRHGGPYRVAEKLNIPFNQGFNGRSYAKWNNLSDKLDALLEKYGYFEMWKHMNKWMKRAIAEDHGGLEEVHKKFLLENPGIIPGIALKLVNERHFKKLMEVCNYFQRYLSSDEALQNIEDELAAVIKDFREDFTRMEELGKEYGFPLNDPYPVVNDFFKVLNADTLRQLPEIMGIYSSMGESGGQEADGLTYGQAKNRLNYLWLTEPKKFQTYLRVILNRSFDNMHLMNSFWVTELGQEIKVEPRFLLPFYGEEAYPGEGEDGGAIGRYENIRIISISNLYNGRVEIVAQVKPINSGKTEIVVLNGTKIEPKVLENFLRSGFEEVDTTLARTLNRVKQSSGSLVISLDDNNERILGLASLWKGLPFIGINHSFLGNKVMKFHELGHLAMLMKGGKRPLLKVEEVLSHVAKKKVLEEYYISKLAKYGYDPISAPLGVKAHYALRALLQQAGRVKAALDLLFSGELQAHIMSQDIADMRKDIAEIRNIARKTKAEVTEAANQRYASMIADINAFLLELEETRNRVMGERGTGIYKALSDMEPIVQHEFLVRMAEIDDALVRLDGMAPDDKLLEHIRPRLEELRRYRGLMIRVIDALPVKLGMPEKSAAYDHWKGLKNDYETITEKLAAVVSNIEKRQEKVTEENFSNVRENIWRAYRNITAKGIRKYRVDPLVFLKDMGRALGVTAKSLSISGPHKLALAKKYFHPEDEIVNISRNKYEYWQKITKRQCERELEELGIEGPGVYVVDLNYIYNKKPDVIIWHMFHEFLEILCVDQNVRDVNFSAYFEHSCMQILAEDQRFAKELGCLNYVLRAREADLEKRKERFKGSEDFEATAKRLEDFLFEANGPHVPPGGSIPGVFRYLYDKKIFSPDTAMDAGMNANKIADGSGMSDPVRRKSLSFKAIERDLNALYFHLHLIEKTDNTANCENAFYYIPDAAREKGAEILNILEKYFAGVRTAKGSVIQPSVGMLKKVYEEEIKPILSMSGSSVPEIARGRYAKLEKLFFKYGFVKMWDKLSEAGLSPDYIDEDKRLLVMGAKSKMPSPLIHIGRELYRARRFDELIAVSKMCEIKENDETLPEHFKLTVALASRERAEVKMLLLRYGYDKDETGTPKEQFDPYPAEKDIDRQLYALVSGPDSEQNIISIINTILTAVDRHTGRSLVKTNDYEIAIRRLQRLIELDRLGMKKLFTDLCGNIMYQDLMRMFWQYHTLGSERLFPGREIMDTLGVKPSAGISIKDFMSPHQKKKKGTKKKIKSKVLPETAKNQAEAFKDMVDYTLAKQGAEPLIIALGTSWIKGYTDKGFQYKAINPLLTTIRRYCDMKGISFIINEDSKLAGLVEKERDRIVKERAKTGTVNTKVIILAGKDAVVYDEKSNAPDIFEPLRNDKEHVFMAGIDNTNLNDRNYVQLMEILTMTLNLYLGLPAQSDTIKVDDKNLYKIPVFVLPPAEPMEYEELKALYEVQKFA